MKNAPADYRSLLDALARCVAACEYCADACLDEDNVQMMVPCIRLDRDCSVLVLISNPAGTTVSQGDRAPPIATSKWSGPLSYLRIVDVPATWAEGDYKVYAGLYAAKPSNGGWENAALTAGPNVVAREGNSCHIATIRVRTDAPPTPPDSAGPATLDLKNHRLTFADNSTT